MDREAQLLLVHCRSTLQCYLLTNFVGVTTIVLYRQCMGYAWNHFI